MTLALKGGSPLNSKKFEWNYNLDEAERAAINEVYDRKILSDFYGSPGPRFLGGPCVKNLDSAWAEAFNVPHAVSMNSATSCLYSAIGAIGIGPGDEVIVPPLTMSASAVCILQYLGIPVFADVERDYFCIDPLSIEKRISPKTKAIVVVNLLGQPANLTAIMELARKHNLKVIEDNAQSPGATLNGRYSGTIGHIGVFSLNCHKAIQTGEGGVAVTSDKDLALRMQLIRNHAEAVVEGMGYHDLDNMVGQNYRMTEIQAAIGLIQLKKLSLINERKQELANALKIALSPFEFLTPPKTRPGATHVYYLYMLRYSAEAFKGIHRNRFVEAVNAEGYQMAAGYVKPLHLLPLFQKRRAFHEFPFNLAPHVRYDQGICPIAEKLAADEMFYPNLIRYRIDHEDIARFAKAIDKVAAHSSELPG